MTVSTLTQSLQVSEVSSIVITAIVPDIAQGDFTREIRILCGADPAAETVVLRLRAATALPLEINAPAALF